MTTELLSPAGDFEKLQMAVLYGADAVYLAGTDFGMRSFAGNFSPEELPQAVAYAHSKGVKVHVTVNTMPRNEEIAQLPAYLEQLQDAGVDALILADLGVDTAVRAVAKLRHRVFNENIKTVANAKTALKEVLSDMLEVGSPDLKMGTTPSVILVCRFLAILFSVLAVGSIAMWIVSKQKFKKNNGRPDKKNGFKMEHLGDYPLKLEKKPE